MTKPNTRMPLTIGGRDLDISQIGYSLRAELKESFPINEVPDYLVEHVNRLLDRLVETEHDIEHFIMVVRRCKDHEDFMSA
jgi:hypothetical protein